jgi:hypothetical protein
MPLAKKITPTKMKTIIMLGQSNQAGGGTNGVHSAIYQGYHKSYIFYKPDATSTNNGVIKNFCFGTNNSHIASWLNLVIPATSLSYQYFINKGEPLLIIKYGYAGSCLVDDGTVSSAGLWQVDASSTNANGLLHYSIAMNNFIIPCINLAKQNNIELDILALHWMQGEGDAQSINRTSQYEVKAKELFDAIKTTLLPYNVLNANYKPIITRIHNSFSPSLIRQAEIRTAHANLATHYNSFMIDSDAFGLQADNVHFNNLGQEAHGLAINNILINNF